MPDPNNLNNTLSVLKAAARVLAHYDEVHAYVQTEMPARALLPEPDRARGRAAFEELRAALARLESEAAQ